MNIKSIVAVALISFASLGAVRPPSPSDRDAVRLTWSDPDNAPGSVVSYRVYSGTATKTYDTFVDVPAASPKVAQIDVTGVVGPRFFVATAVDANGLESLPSAELRLDIRGRPNAPSELSGTRITIIVE